MLLLPELEYSEKISLMLGYEPGTGRCKLANLIDVPQFNALYFFNPGGIVVITSKTSRVHFNLDIIKTNTDLQT